MYKENPHLLRMFEAFHDINIKQMHFVKDAGSILPDVKDTF